jgi:hypothetical protein
MQEEVLVFSSPKQFIDWLENNRCCFLNDETGQPDSFYHITTGLLTEGRVTLNSNYDPTQFGTALDYYHSSEAMQRIPHPFSDSLSAIQWIIAHRDVLGSHTLIQGKPYNSIAHYMTCLYAGNKLFADNPVNFTYDAGAAEFAVSNSVLMSCKNYFTDHDEAIDWLVQRRVLIGSRNHDQESNSLVYLMRCLAYLNKIPRKKLNSFLIAAGAADYAFKHMDLYKSELDRLAGQGLPAAEVTFQMLNRNLFRNSRKPEQPLSVEYFRRVFNYFKKYCRIRT